MPISAEDREHVLASAVEILRHPQREKLLRIISDRIQHDAYDDEHERELDRIVFAIARSIGDELS